MTVSMDVVQQRAVIRFVVLQKKKPKEIHEKLLATLGDNAFVCHSEKMSSSFQGWLGEH